MTEKGKPKKDGSGDGDRKNMNRGECDNPPIVGRGKKLIDIIEEQYD